MGKFGFDDEPLKFDKLPAPRDRKQTPAPDSPFETEALSLGFTDRTAPKLKKLETIGNRKPGRKPPTEPKSKILISGPESIIHGFKQYCEKNGNIPYWEALKIFLDDSI